MNKKPKWLTGTVFIWSLFDFANSSYAVIVVAFVYAVYFKKVVASNLPIADFYWSSSINISMLAVAVLSPVLGAAADFYSNKKTYLFFFTLLCIITTALMYFVGPGMVLWGVILFIFSNIGFQAGLSFYDAFVKEIALPENYNRVSSLGYAIGYVGSLAALVPVFIYQNDPRLSFVASSFLFLIFSLPFFLFIKEKKKPLDQTGEKFNAVRVGISRVSNTLHHLKNYINLRTFLLSYFLYIDGVNTVIFFSAIYAQTTLGFTISELVIFFAIVQITAMIGSFLFGFIADRIGTKFTLELCLIGWLVITVVVFFINDKLGFNIIGALAGMFLGSSQALSRSMMTFLTPEEKKTEFFGFYGLFEKTSTILGPFTFGLVSWLTGNQRFAILSISFFFITGFLLLKKVKYPKAIIIENP
ncbi:MAG: MFS transporter [Ignavibacteria bacterium]|jgi:UMF1 family MFS transporter